MKVGVQKNDWEQLSIEAWKVRDNAFLYGKTKVGAALLSETKNIFIGCNVEQRFRSHDIHAEVNAIGNFISSGGKKILAILVVAERDNFTPCGSCMDWILQFACNDCIVGFQNKPGTKIYKFKAQKLMPFYPY